MDYSKYNIEVTGEASFASFFHSLPPDNEVRKKLDKMLEELKVKPDAGDQIPRKQWPKAYKDRGFANVFRYEVDASMRATYTIRVADNYVKVAIIEFFETHKKYEQRFGY